MIFHKTNPDHDGDILIAFYFSGKRTFTDGYYSQRDDEYYDYWGEVIKDVIAWTERPMLKFDGEQDG